MSINQISTANTFGQLVTAVSAMIAVANNLTDGPQVVTNAAWTFSNPGVGINVGNTALISTGNISLLNASQANVTNETVGRSNISTANVTVANIVGATITNVISTDHLSANANITGLLQVSDRANVYSANIQYANIGTVAITSLSVSELTVPVLNVSFANVTDLSVSGTSQHQALIATLVTTDNANARIINVSSANISNSFVATLNASVANITSLTVGTQNISTANITTLTGLVSLSTTFANITTETVGTANISTANITNLFANVANLVSVNIASTNITSGSISVTANPTSNLQVATKNYVDTGAGANLVNKLSFNAKGDVILGTGANTYATLVAGSNGQVLIVDTTQTTGMRYSGRPAQGFRGLSMGTSQADKVANGNQIIVYKLDEATMDDGEVVTGWTVPATIDITSNGAGFLDTGVVLANTWYEVYAIRKRSDGTKNFILHRALDRNVDQNTTNTVVFAYNTTLAVNKTTSPNVKVAQSFTPNVSGPLTSLEIQMFKTGTPVGNVWLTLEANTAQAPSGVALATSRKYDVAKAQTAHMNVRFVFDATANVVAGNSYFWVYQTDYSASDTNFTTLEGSTTAYTTGVVKGFNGGSYVTLTPGIGVLTFKTYQEANSTSVTFPTGYDQKCLIGYVATDGNSKLREFRQRDRTINTFTSYQWMGFATKQIANPEVADLTNVVPPIHCEVVFIAIQASGGINFANYGSLDALDIPNNTNAGMENRGFVYGGAGTQGSIGYMPTPPIWIEQQAMMVHVGVAITKFYISSFTF